MDVKQAPVNAVLSVSMRSSCSFPERSSDVKSRSYENESLTQSQEPPPLLPVESIDSQLPLKESFVTVPPATPGPAFSFQHQYTEIPRPFRQHVDLKLPYIREVGIKNSLDILSGYFNCEDYKLNMVKFWFLDVITDCLWKMQDEFQFPEAYQKIIVEWVLYSMDLIRDPQRNLSRKEFFQIFNEAMVISHERVQGGCEFLPSPAELFSFVENEEVEISFPSSSSTSEDNSSVSSSTETTERESYLAAGIDENTPFFKMPKSPPKYCKQFGSRSSEKISESLEEEHEISVGEETSIHSSLDSVDFYQPDLNTPERFYSSSSSSFHSVPGEDDFFSPLLEEKVIWKRDSLITKKKCSDESIYVRKANSIPALQPENLNASESVNIIQSNHIRNEWTNYLEDRKDYVEGMEKNILINSCALFAIKQFIYDYFYETFQFTVAKFALINTFSSITQSINSKWFVPKVLKEELKKPKPKKEKKKKKKKDKKPRKKTKSKRDKKKKKHKKKKDKRKKKHKKKDKKSKKKKLTKAEKAELARLKREQQRLEEERLREEENRRLLFPLKDATTDDFFKSIFEHWVRPKGKKGKGKKSKKGKHKGKKGIKK